MDDWKNDVFGPAAKKEVPKVVEKSSEAHIKFAIMEVETNMTNSGEWITVSAQSIRRMNDPEMPAMEVEHTFPMSLARNQFEEDLMQALKSGDRYIICHPRHWGSVKYVIDEYIKFGYR